MAFYCLARTGGPTQCSRTVGDLTDATVAAGTTYSYQLQVFDFHLNSSSTTVSVTTPAAGTVDLRRVGLRSTGAYWGGMGEQIDVRSGNMNFSLPLVKAQGRGGWSVPVGLSYNSQNWPQDGSTSWNLGEDVGYGYGWRLAIGSLTPVWGSSAVHHYTFTDSTGAEYRLDQQSTDGAGHVIWTSKDTFYATYDATAGRLYFNDGSFWSFGSVSGGTEPDAGVMYPTLIENSNGNQILVRYATGMSMVWPNTSGRIVQIEDVRAQAQSGGSYVTYAFNYDTNTPPRLTSITNNIVTSEGYTFSYSGATALNSPFDSSSFGTANRLSGITIAGVGLSYGFSGDTAGEMTQVTFPYGGYLKWNYAAWTYSGSRKQMEVGTRTHSKDGTVGSEKAYTFYNSGEASGGALHGRTDLDDPSGGGGRTWFYATNGGTAGLLTSLERYNNPGPVVASLDAFTWTQDSALRWYVGTSTSTMDGTATKKSTQTLDSYGNLTQSQIFNYGDLVNPARTYANTFVTNSNYTSRYIRNRLLTTTLNGSLTLVSNVYDVGTITDLTSPRQHDSAFGTSYTYRGNVTSSTTLAGTTTMSYDIGGNAVSTTGPTGTVSSATYGSGTNYAAPATISTGSLTETLGYSTFLGLTQATGPNGDSSATAFDSYARPATSTSPTGAVTTYAYAGSAPWTVTATTNGRWVKTTLDGFGRTVKAESGYSSTTLSVVETSYDPCGCSPMGKTKQVSMPHASGAGAVWTVYTYDGLGRTTRVTNPDSSHKDYVYSGSTVTATDEAGAWKKYTMDAMDNLSQVEEPNPAGGSFFTTYTYDVLNHLTGVSMPRPTGTQTRTFNYGTPPGIFLLSATNPESGTASHSYSQSRLASKTDAKGQQIQYTYDDKNRVTQVRHYLAGGAEDTCQQVNFTYDSNGVDGFNYLSGRLATRSYSVCLAPNGTSSGAVRTDFTEMFSYTQAGQVAVKRLRVARAIYLSGVYQTTVQRDLDGSWAYDNEGKMTSVTYPVGSGGPTAGTYTFGYDSAGRPTTMNDSSAGVITGVTYGPAGELLTMTGPGYSESRSYNSRLQLTALNGVTFTYPTANNGKIATQSDSVSGESITFQYDSLNRLISAVSNGTWGQTFGYDGFGNLTAKAPASGKTSATYSAAFTNNREVGLSYDANGNQLSDLANYGSLQYDVENRLSWGQKGVASNGSGYGYDPSNKRVYTSTWTYSSQWNVSSEEITYWGIGGQKMGTYGLSASSSGMLLTAAGYNVYFGSKLVRKVDSLGTATPVQADRLGSFGKFAPYGEERTASADNTEKFATYYRDGNTGLDYAVNRYYDSANGRFLSPDPYQASGGPADPGSWNGFSYVVGDPNSSVDPMGLDSVKFLCLAGPAPTAGSEVRPEYTQCEAFFRHVEEDFNSYATSKSELADGVRKRSREKNAKRNAASAKKYFSEGQWKPSDGPCSDIMAALGVTSGQISQTAAAVKVDTGAVSQANGKEIAFVDPDGSITFDSDRLGSGVFNSSSGTVTPALGALMLHELLHSYGATHNTHQLEDLGIIQTLMKAFPNQALQIKASYLDASTSAITAILQAACFND